VEFVTGSWRTRLVSFFPAAVAPDPPALAPREARRTRCGDVALSRGWILPSTSKVRCDYFGAGRSFSTADRRRRRPAPCRPRTCRTSTADQKRASARPTASRPSVPPRNGGSMSGSTHAHPPCSNPPVRVPRRAARACMTPSIDMTWSNHHFRSRFFAHLFPFLPGTVVMPLTPIQRTGPPDIDNSPTNPKFENQCFAGGRYVDEAADLGQERNR